MVDGSGNVYFADSGNQAIKEMLNVVVGPVKGFTSRPQPDPESRIAIGTVYHYRNSGVLGPPEAGSK